MAQLRREATQSALDSERALREANERLESRVAERTAELSNALQQLQAEVAERERAQDLLRQAQKMDAIGQLTGGVAHDFNNLLTAIIGGAERLRRRLPEQPGSGERQIERSLEMIEQAAKRAATLTQQLLAFGRRQALIPRALDANQLVSGMSELLRRTLGETVVIQTTLAGELWPAMCDPNQLENALLNLALNARDAMPRGGRLSIATANVRLDRADVAPEELVQPGEYVLISVRDTGTGMAKATLARAFEPFFTTKAPGHGTGLGLSQVYGFIRQSDGHIAIESEPGQGTEVRLYLPTLEGEGALTAEVPPWPTSPPAGKGELVLLVEDHDAVRAHSAETLRELGYQVLAVTDGAAALDALENQPVRALFTDIGLPGDIDGSLLAKRVRERRPDLPVLFTTGYAGEALASAAILPRSALLPKPFTRVDLAIRLRALLDG